MLSSCRSAAPITDATANRVTVPLGTIMVAPDSRELVLTGYVNLVRGPVEYFACGPGGKTYESIFMLYADPKDVHAGLMLLGLKHGSSMPGRGQGPPVGDSVEVSIEWELDGRAVSRKAEAFLYDTMKKKAPVSPGWVFNGSTIEDGMYMAGADESFIATYWDPWAIINIQSAVGSDDERIMIHRKNIPPLHTPVKMVIQGAPEE